MIMMIMVVLIGYIALFSRNQRINWVNITIQEFKETISQCAVSIFVEINSARGSGPLIQNTGTHLILAR